MNKRKNCVDFPEDCWVLIVNSLNHDGRHFKFISLVSRQFLNITNQLHRRLRITKRVIPLLPSVIRRFPNLNEIKICDLKCNLNLVLCQISQGLVHRGSKIRSTLRILNCARTSFLKDDDLVAIANMFPSLEELDISYFQKNKDLDTEHCSSETNISDAGILQLSLQLPKLHKINLSGNKFLTDGSIISLSSNCLLLRELVIYACNFTTKGIGTALRDCHHLDSISLSVSRVEALYEFCAKSFAYAVNLSELDLCFSIITDEFLGILAEARLPLKKLTMSHCYGFTYIGISNLLQKYGSLVYLDFGGMLLLTDQKVAEISKFLRNITYINLNSCSQLTSSAFFALIRNCPLLSNIEWCHIHISLGIQGFETDFAVSYQVKYLQFCENANVCDEFIQKMALACPNLQDLILTHCHGITVKGINEVLRNCHEIKHLDISWCTSITEFTIDIQLPNLEYLNVMGLVFDHKSFEIIRERCPRCLVRNSQADGLMVKKHFLTT